MVAALPVPVHSSDVLVSKMSTSGHTGDMGPRLTLAMPKEATLAALLMLDVTFSVSVGLVCSGRLMTTRIMWSDVVVPQRLPNDDAVRLLIVWRQTKLSST